MCAHAHALRVVSFDTLTVPVLVAMDGDDVLCGVEEPLAIVGPEQGAG